MAASVIDILYAELLESMRGKKNVFWLRWSSKTDQGFWKFSFSFF